MQGITHFYFSPIKIDTYFNKDNQCVTTEPQERSLAKYTHAHATCECIGIGGMTYHPFLYLRLEVSIV